MDPGTKVYLLRHQGIFFENLKLLHEPKLPTLLRIGYNPKMEQAMDDALESKAPLLRYLTDCQEEGQTFSAFGEEKVWDRCSKICRIIEGNNVWNGPGKMEKVKGNTQVTGITLKFLDQGREIMKNKLKADQEESKEGGYNWDALRGGPQNKRANKAKNKKVQN